MRASEIAHHILFGVATLLVSDNDATLRSKHSHSAWHCAIIGKAAVAVQFNPVRKTALNVIEREGPLIMSGDLDPLPGRQIIVNMTACFAKLYLQFFYRRAEVDVVLRGMTLQILQPPF